VNLFFCSFTNIFDIIGMKIEHRAKRIYCVVVFVNLLLIPFLFNSQNVDSKNKVVKKVPTEANQGVAVDKNYYYAISNTRITKYIKISDETVATWQAETNSKGFEHFKHMNSGTVIDGKLYVAHSRYSIDPNDNTIEIFNVKNDLLEYEKTIPMPRKHGSLTWIDQHPDGSWWMCYAVYGKNVNNKTKLVKYNFKNAKFAEVRTWFFPKEVVENWGDMSCSGGSWGADGYLYTTGHDHAKAFVLQLDKFNELIYLRTESDLGFYGQAIAWDRFSKIPMLWGIEKRKFVTATVISEK
jgi:hypothetical protein